MADQKLSDAEKRLCLQGVKCKVVEALQQGLCTLVERARAQKFPMPWCIIARDRNGDVVCEILNFKPTGQTEYVNLDRIEVDSPLRCELTSATGLSTHLTIVPIVLSKQPEAAR